MAYSFQTKWLITLSFGTVCSIAAAQTQPQPPNVTTPVATSAQLTPPVSSAAPTTTTTLTETANAVPAATAIAPVVTQSQPAGFYYYCEREKAYYPTITHCSEGWIAIPVGAPPPFVEHHWQTPTRPATADEVRSRPNVASIELFGRALVYSLNYDRAVSEHLTLGIGITSWHISDRWQDFSSTVTVVPLYGNYYFSENAGRGYVSAGLDLISSTGSGDNNGTFSNSGVAGVLGGGYEYRDKAGFLIRLGGDLILGRSVEMNPSLGLGYAF